MNLINIVSRKKVESIVANYYVDSLLGDDLNDGSLAHPFKTSSKITSLNLVGKTVAFKKGREYDKLTIQYINSASNNKTYLKAYGSGEAPVFSSAVTLSGVWNNVGNVWSYQDNNFPTEITNVWVNSNKGVLGRFPKSGFRTVTGGSTSTLIDSTLTDPDGYWDGCEIVGKAQPWLVERRRATYASKTFTYTAGWQVQVGFGYFIQNHVNCLTVANEWAYNPTTKTLYIYSTSQPNNVQVTYEGSGIYINNCSNIDISNIKTDKTNQYGIYVNQSDGVNIDSCTITNCGLDGVYTNNCTYINVTNSNLSNIDGNGVYFYVTKYCNVLNNTINICGYTIGKGVRGQLWGNGILATYLLDGLKFQHNTITNIGYCGIYWKQCNNMEVDSNYISNYCLRMCDGGGVYTFKNNATDNSVCATPFVQNKITNNIIKYGQSGDADQGQNTGYTAHGIYLDNECDTMYLHNNSILYGCYSGMLIKGDSHDIQYNTIYSYKEGLHLERGVGDSRILNNNTVTNNNSILELQSGQTTAVWAVYTYNTVNSSVNFLTNKYYFPFGQLASKTNKYFNMANTEWTLQQWKDNDAVMNWNRSGEQIITPSLFANSVKPRLNFIKILENPTVNNLVVQTSDLPYNDYINLDGSTPTYPITVLPYQSLILVRTEI